MLEEFKERIEHAKNKPYLALQMFEIGDIVYPFFAHNLVNWGTVVDINPVTRKITVNFNGINRQFDPEWLIKTNPEIKTASINKHKVAHNFHKMVQALYYKEAPSIFKMSQDEKETGEALCPKCKSVLEINYDIENKEAVLTCTNCGKTINKSKIASMNKFAGKVKELLMSFEQFAEKYPNKEIKKENIKEEYSKYFREWRNVVQEFQEDIIEVLKKKGIKVI